jgi:CRP-like cAMP-binding protein
MEDDSRTPGRLLGLLREQGSRRHYRRGEVLFSEGDVGQRVFVLERGWVLIRSADADGREVVLGLRGPGEVLGELSALDGRPRSATAVAADDIEVVITPAHVLQTALARDHEATRELLMTVVDRLREADSRRLEYTTMDTLARVATRLLELTDRFGERLPEGVRVELPLVQEDLARWCGASRESTVKALRTLRALGVVTTARRTVTVHDVAGLRQAAHGMVLGK